MKIQTPCRLRPDPGEHDANKLECTLPMIMLSDNISRLVFTEKRFVKILREKNRFFEVSVKTVFLFEFCFGVDIDK